MRKLKIGFWIGFLSGICGIALLTWAWFYYHQTKPVPYLNKTLPAGAVINFEKDVVLKQRLLPDLPANYVSPDLLKSQTWRAIHTIDPTDPLTPEKITNKSAFTMSKDQVIISDTFTNSGLLSYIKPGDRVEISEGTKSIPDVLVLGKADKSGNITDLLPALQDLDSGSNPISSALSSSATTPPDSMIMLMTKQQSQILNVMKNPQVAMDGRPQMIVDGGAKDGQTMDNTQPDQSR